jgi:hypothetical protein
LVGVSGRSLARIRNAAIGIGLVGGVAFYLYGPAVTPALHEAAATECNELTSGNYRSYALEWVVGVRPHWLCGDRRDLAKAPVDLGWWVTPRL